MSTPSAPEPDTRTGKRLRRRVEWWVARDELAGDMDATFGAVGRWMLARPWAIWLVTATVIAILLFAAPEGTDRSLAGTLLDLIRGVAP